MLSRAAKYFLPIGGTAFVMPSTVFAGCDDPPKKDDCSCGCVGLPASEDDCKDTELERLVMMCRTELGPLTASGTDFAKDFYKKIRANMCYLRTKAPEEVRMGTVAAGGLIGMMFGFRRGLTKKLLYGTVGAVGASFLVYPKQSMYYAKNGFSIAKQKATNSYNFVMEVGNSNNECSIRSDAPAAKLKAQKADQNIKCK